MAKIPWFGHLGALAANPAGVLVPGGNVVLRHAAAVGLAAGTADPGGIYTLREDALVVGPVAVAIDRPRGVAFAGAHASPRLMPHSPQNCLR